MTDLIILFQKWIQQFDYFFIQKINTNWVCTWADQFFPWYTDLSYQAWFRYVIIPLLLFFFIKKFKRAGISYFLFLILALAVSDFAGGKIKRIIERPRPFQNTELSIVQKSKASENVSFYSNHSSNMFTFASYMSAFFPCGSTVFYGLAILTGYSRMYNGVHYPTDVIFGAIMGYIWGILFSLIIKLMIQKFYRSKNEAI